MNTKTKLDKRAQRTHNAKQFICKTNETKRINFGSFSEKHLAFWIEIENGISFEYRIQLLDGFLFLEHLELILEDELGLEHEREIQQEIQESNAILHCLDLNRKLDFDFAEIVVVRYSQRFQSHRHPRHPNSPVAGRQRWTQTKEDPCHEFDFARLSSSTF